jgi:hypothetical protein
MRNLFTLLVAMLPLIATAQNSEIGLSGGIGIVSAPSGSIYFKADQSTTAPSAMFTYVANLNRYSESKLTWQVGFDITSYINIKHESSQTYDYFTKTIGNDGKYFRYAKVLLSVSPLVNMKYKLSDVTYVYGGMCVGIAGTNNTSNRKPQDFEGSEYTYKAPDGGKGFVAGMHLGITQRIVQRLAVNAQVGFRYYNLGFNVDDRSYPGGTSFRYSTTIIPVMVGIRYRMGWLKEYNSYKGRYQIVQEEIKHKKDSTE